LLPLTAHADPIKIEPDPKAGFHWPYHLHLPTKLRDGPVTLLVVPNNTGSPDDDFAVHEKAAVRLVERSRTASDPLGVGLLVPVFPRPKTGWQTYTQALDRDALLTKDEKTRRLDKQLVAMIDHALAKVRADGKKADDKVLLFGFSASGMFVNRFAFLHPERVRAAAIGSPGGWPLAPVAKVKQKELRYPIGVGDFETVTGKPLDTKTLARVPLFFFMGDQDANDSVIFRDSYDEPDEKLIAELFGKTPVERWPAAERLYKETLPRATFKLYPGVAHRITKEMAADVRAFFEKHLK
jgi:pimeloyl-ACP methyl ester carboxylesterase